MAKWNIGDGMDEYLKVLDKLNVDAELLIKRSVYKGAGVVAGIFESAIDAIPSTLVSDVQRQGLHDGLGLAKMRNDNGYINTKIGFAGYNDDPRQWQSSWKANSFVARRVCAGTVHQPAYDFVRKAVNTAKGPAEQAMKDQFDLEISKIMK